MIQEFIIPSNRSFCHAATVIGLSGRQFLAAWFSGSIEGSKDTEIIIARRDRSGWLPPTRIAKIGDIPHWNPVLFQMPDKRIVLYFKTGNSPETWQTNFMTSEDEGISWTNPQKLARTNQPAWYGPVKNQPLILQNGTVLAPCSYENQDDWQPEINISQDGGISWDTASRHIPIPDKTILKPDGTEGKLGIIQPALWESQTGHVHALMRSNDNQIYRSDSEDNGLTWCKAYPTDIPNNNSGIDVKQLTDGRLVLVCNLPLNDDLKSRNNLSMLISEDNGITWKHRITLEAMQKGKLTDDHWLEFSYPTVAITPDGRIAVVYTWHRFNIRFLCGTAEEFISGAWNYFVPTYEKTLGNPAIAIPQVPPEWLGSHALSSATGCLFASYNYGNLHPISPGQTEDSFTSFVSIGWNLQGLCFNFIVKSDAIDSHEKVPGTFYIRSCAELFLAPEDGKLWTRNNFSFERIQLMLSQPDEDGQIENCVIYDGCFHGPEYPPLNHIAVGERIQNGCMVHILLPWQSLGYSSIHDVIPSLRIQINTHSYQITDGKITEDRRMTLNGEPVLYSSSDCYPTFCLCNRIQDNPFPSLDTAWNPAVPALFETDEAEIPLNMPDWLDYGIVSIQDSESGTRLFTRRLAPNQSTLTLNNLASWHAIGLHFQFSGYIQGQCIGIVERQATLSAWLTTLLARTDWRNLKDWKILGMAALVSALEFLRLTHTANALNRFRRSDAIWECSARLALLDNRPLPAGTPDYLHLLELQRGFQAQLNVSFSQGGRSYERKSAAISLPWGNIPVVNCEITQCRTEEEAKVGFTQTTAFFTPIEAPHINGADSVFAGYGFLMMDALKNDLEPHRQVSVISKNWPHQSLRLPPEDALKLPIEAIVLLPDTPETMKKVLFSQAASRNLPLIDWANRTDYSLVAVGGIPPFNEISSFWHSRNGLPGKILVARKEKNIFWTQYEIPELGIEFLEFILKGAPITQEQAAHFASLRASHLPKPKPKDRAQVSHLWTGDVHTHSTASDGQSTPLGLRFNAIPPGFDFIVISDHDEIQGALDLIRKFRNCHCRLPIFAGQEITRQPRYHLNVYPIHQKITDVATWEIIKKAAAAQNAIVQLNHPMTYGTELSDAWYGDFTLSGCDAVERRFEYWPTWQQTGKGHLPAMTGSTDAHFGIFGFLTCTVLLADSLTETTLAEAIRQGKTACIDPMTGMLAYGNEDLCRIIAAALMDSSSPERFFNRLKDNFSDFSFFYPLSTNQKGETKHA